MILSYFIVTGIYLCLVAIGLMIVAIKHLSRRLDCQNRILQFDRRIIIYQAAHALIEALMLQKSLSDDAFLNFKSAIVPAPFLLDDALSHALEELAKCAQSIQKLRAEMSPSLGTNERVALAQRLTDENTWVSEFANSLDARFAPYLKA